eukprot:1906294-Ditylum_brightwellii.AAC.1
MDPNPWSKTECFAPITTQLELQLLVAEAVQMKQTVKGVTLSKPSAKVTSLRVKTISYDHPRIAYSHLRILTSN